MAYWELKYDHLTRNSIKQLLEQNGRSTHSAKTPNEVALIGLERGLLDYKKYAIPELRKFAKGRNINVRGISKKSEIINRLEDDDGNKSFPQFQKLPLELRLMVYEYSMSRLTDDKHTISDYIQPAVTRVSRMIRNESLPVFYAINRFALFVESSRTNWYNLCSKIDMVTRAFLAVTNEQNLRHIRHLALVRIVKPRHRAAFQEGWIDVDLSSKRCASCPVTTSASYHLSYAEKNGQVSVHADVLSTLENLARTPGVGNFGRNEMEAIANVFVQAVIDHFR
ncbi:hypothetical protein H2203_008371 [Taxawa tesnikishii (nom. ined.)]|nr:hypothetical protein H2203_008371 [Dothideales sp. JES 119]